MSHTNETVEKVQTCMFVNCKYS